MSELTCACQLRRLANSLETGNREARSQIFCTFQKNGPPEATSFFCSGTLNCWRANQEALRSNLKRLARSRKARSPTSRMSHTHCLIVASSNPPLTYSIVGNSPAMCAPLLPEQLGLQSRFKQAKSDIARI